MRTIGQILWWLLLAAIGWWALQSLAGLSIWQSAGPQSQEQGYSKYPVYWLEQPQVYNIPTNAVQLRVMMTPIATPQDSQFSIDYETYDTAGKLVAKGTRHYRQPGISELPVGSPVNRYFANDNGQPANQTSEFYIDSDKARPLASLKLMRNSNELSTTTAQLPVAIRVSMLDHKKAEEVPILWQRMRREKRLDLLAGHIYPPDLVPEAARHSALQYQWLPIGPEGIAGKDHQTDSLMVKTEIELAEPDQTLQMNISHYADHNKYFTLEQDPQTPVHQIRCKQPQAWIELTVQDQQLHAPERIFTQNVAIANTPGLYRIRTSSPCHIELLDVAGERVEKNSNVIRTYLAKPNQPLSYALAPTTTTGKADSSKLQPLRVDIRGLDLASQDISIQWQLLDSAGNILLEGKRSLPTENDNYERLPLDVTQQLHQKTEIYLVAPANASNLIIRSPKKPVLVNSFSRPYQLAYRQSEPKWFSLLPKDYQQLKTQDRSQLIYWQARLNETPTPTALSQWIPLGSLKPVPSWELFAINDAKEPLPPGLNYQLLEAPVNRPKQITLVDLPGRSSIEADLIYLRARQNQTSINIEFGNSLPFILAAPAGRIKLPQVPPGSYSLTINDDGSNQWFMNHQNGESGYRIRQVYQLNEPLQLTLTKREAQEWVTLHYYSTVAQSHQLTMTISYDAVSGEQSGLTLPRRIFDQPAQTTAAQNHLLNQNHAPLWGPSVFSFPLEQDLPNQNYHLRITSSLPNSGYIQAAIVDHNVALKLKHINEVTNEY